MQMEQEITKNPDFQHLEQGKKEKNNLKFREIYLENKNLVLEMVELGFCNMKQVLKQIYKNKGQKEKIIENLKKKQEKDSEKSQKQQEKQQKDENSYSEQFMALIQKGYKNPVQVYKTLQKVNGDQQEAEKILEFKIKNSKFLKESKNRSFSEQKEQIKFLLQNQIERPVMINQVLRRFENDCQKALKFFQELEENKEKKGKFERKEKKEKNEKNEKKLEKEEKIKERREKKQRKDQEFGQLAENIKGLSLEDWQEKFEYLYVDGNNLFYVLPAIRNLIIQNRGKGQEQAEKILGELVRKYSEKFKKMQKTVLIFDSTRRVENGQKFQVLSARPNFQTSDDNFVFLSENFSQEQKEKSVFITSDRGLVQRLQENGVKFCVKSGLFFDQMKNVLEAQFEEIVQDGVKEFQKEQHLKQQQQKKE
ncbi:hypothetical protein PPERSA_09223 [Pseudocohnilembus persalinus]|uniref:NYN domain-containing protein n=1 Tax=Pseudocohnilembus persalinus TaxID=266149 RepID=A0A0V0R4C5_PSEPJ|nr:hypothetical protein PPERSA_09223 [Pseudocohnilembus persalinus]|eukprot:KRX09339.1 hypothetical protein PPERSA_09223 [Pseudocohnilembus persalinus]